MGTSNLRAEFAGHVKIEIATLSHFEPEGSFDVARGKAYCAFGKHQLPEKVNSNEP